MTISLVDCDTFCWEQAGSCLIVDNWKCLRSRLIRWFFLYVNWLARPYVHSPKQSESKCPKKGPSKSRDSVQSTDSTLLDLEKKTMDIIFKNLQAYMEYIWEYIQDKRTLCNFLRFVLMLLLVVTGFALLLSFMICLVRKTFVARRKHTSNKPKSATQCQAFDYPSDSPLTIISDQWSHTLALRENPSWGRGYALHLVIWSAVLIIKHYIEVFDLSKWNHKCFRFLNKLTKLSVFYSNSSWYASSKHGFWPIW